MSAEVVLPDGRIVGVRTGDAELHWALRGGGGNFGVVTEFEFALHPVGPMVQLGLLFLFSPDQGPEMSGFARDFVADLPDESMAFLAGLSTPPEPFVPPELHFTSAFALVVVGLADEAAHARMIEPIKATLRPIVELVTPFPTWGCSRCSTLRRGGGVPRTRRPST